MGRFCTLLQMVKFSNQLQPEMVTLRRVERGAKMPRRESPAPTATSAPKFEGQLPANLGSVFEGQALHLGKLIFYLLYIWFVLFQ